MWLELPVTARERLESTVIVSNWNWNSALDALRGLREETVYKQPA